MNATELAQAIRGGLIQQDRLLKTDIPSLPDHALVPRRAMTRSELGRDFSVTLDLVSTASDVELKTLIAQPITLWIQQADRSYRPINGYVHTARRLGADGSLSSYQLTFASWMHFLKFRSDMRYWQDQSVDAILADVFDAHPQAKGRYQFALSRPLPSRSYCRQSETDWNFVHRLMEDEGLFGFWRHADDGKTHTLVITDDLHAVDELAPKAVGFDRSGTGAETTGFTQWAASRTLQSTLHTTRTFDYKSPSSAGNPNGTTLPTRPGAACRIRRKSTNTRAPTRIRVGPRRTSVEDPPGGMGVAREAFLRRGRCARDRCGPALRAGRSSGARPRSGARS